MIPTVDTFRFKEEFYTNSNPMLFLCNVTDVYYVKYIQQPKEFDQLVYELLCAKLCRHYGIPSPDVALVNAVEGSFDPMLLNKNRQYFKPGVVAFGSKLIEHTDPLNKMDAISSKPQFKRLQNPLDLVKIGMFDLHTDNRDRWEENYNLLIQRDKRTHFYAIDHTECFCGTANLGRFNPGIHFNLNMNIFRSPYFLQMIKYVSIKEVLDTMDEYIYLSHPFKPIQGIIDEVFAYIPDSWQTSAGLKQRIEAFLSHHNRLSVIQEEVKNLMLYYKREN